MWPTALARQAGADVILWVVMLAALLGLAWFFSRQTRPFEALLSRPDTPTQRRLHALVRQRGWMVCSLWGFLTLTVIIHDLRHPTEADAATSSLPLPPASVSVVGAPSPTQSLSPVQRDIEIDKIKTYFEDAFVSYYYLHKCRVARPEDNTRLYQALWHYLAVFDATANAPQVMSAAQGSFEIIYSRTGCEPKTLDPVRQRFDTFIKALPEATPAQP